MKIEGMSTRLDWLAHRVKMLKVDTLTYGFRWTCDGCNRQVPIKDTPHYYHGTIGNRCVHWVVCFECQEKLELHNSMTDGRFVDEFKESMKKFKERIRHVVP